MDEAAAASSAMAQQQQQHQQQQQQKLFLQQQQQQQQRQQLLLLQQYQQHQQQQFQMQQQQQQQQHPQQQQHQQQQQQQHMQQQQQQKHLQQIQQQQQQQQAMSRFPSNIDAHLRSPGLRSLHLHQQQQPQQQQQQPQQQQQQSMLSQQQQQQQQQSQQKVVNASVATTATGVGRQASQVEVEMAMQDAWKVCNPDVKRPFSSVEDALHRLLPYHIVADYEAEEDDRILDSDISGQVPSRLQQWDHNILTKLAEFTSTFEKQVLAFNIMSRKRALGEFRSEERLMIEQVLLQEEKQTLLQLRSEFESREKAEREAAEAKMRMAMAQVEQARAEASARAPIRSSEASGHDDRENQLENTDDTMPGWGGNGQREDDEPSDDYLNDENEPDNGEAGGLQGEWREAGKLDLNTR